ncbi:MAG: hypothetical protein HYX34_13345 [Actinobacteria bacterium]|nr:hypothetical protein [Actinomycetota bacterium]
MNAAESAVRSPVTPREGRAQPARLLAAAALVVAVAVVAAVALGQRQTGRLRTVGAGSVISTSIDSTTTAKTEPGAVARGPQAPKDEPAGSMPDPRAPLVPQGLVPGADVDPELGKFVRATSAYGLTIGDVYVYVVAGSAPSDDTLGLQIVQRMKTSGGGAASTFATYRLAGHGALTIDSGSNDQLDGIASDGTRWQFDPTSGTVRDR